MRIGVLTLRVSLPGCRSLKEKRQRLGGLHERIGRHPAVAVCESGAHDRLETSEWSFVAVAPSVAQVEARLAEIEDRFQRRVDGRVLSATRELL